MPFISNPKTPEKFLGLFTKKEIQRIARLSIEYTLKRKLNRKEKKNFNEFFKEVWAKVEKDLAKSKPIESDKIF